MDKTYIQILLQAGVTFTVFFLGYFANRSFEKWKEKRRLNDLKEYTLASLHNLIKPANSQINCILRDSKSFKEVNDTNDYVITLIVDLNINKFDKLNFTDLYKVFVTKDNHNREKRIILFQELERTINLIREAKNSIKTLSESFLPRYEKYKSVWDKNTKAIGEFNDSISRQAVLDKIT